MKKYIAAFILAAVATFSACGAEPDYFSYVSELRNDVLAGENDNFGVVVYSGMKENPAISDGIKNDTELTLTVKIFLKTEIAEQLTAIIEYDGNKYEKTLEYNPVKSALTADVRVLSVPNGKLDVAIVYGEKTEIISVVSKLNENTVEYMTALKTAAAKAKDFIKENTRNGVLKAEIYLRLICENDRNYYYVGFATAEGLKKAYLIDGESGAVLAEKDV